MLSANFTVRATRTGRPDAVSLFERLERLPKQGAPLDRAVDIRWNEYGIPFIEAANDADLATTLGLVHAHLRIAEMELLRRLAQGQLTYPRRARVSSILLPRKKPDFRTRQQK